MERPTWRATSAPAAPPPTFKPTRCSTASVATPARPGRGCGPRPPADLWRPGAMTTVGLLTLLGLRAQNAANVPVGVDCRAVLFALDGVLVASPASGERHWAAFAARQGLELQAIRHATLGRRSPDTIRE